MTETLPLRDYQRAAIDKLTEGWRAGRVRLAVVLPTGAGKTVVFSHLANLIHHRQHVRTLIIAHRDELIQQAAAKVKAVAPHLTVGIVKAEQDEHQDADVIVASIQTLAVPKRRVAITGIGLVIVDEAHHAAAPTYVDVLKHFGCFDRTPTAGFTATMKREDGGLATVWEEVVYTRDILEMIRDRHLVDVRGKKVVVDELALDDVASRGGDFQEGQLGQALDDSGASKVVADAYIEHAADRPGVVFTPTVATAHTMAEALTAAGIPTGVVSGEMPRAERVDTLTKFSSGELQVLSNCSVLTEGFDAPWTSCAVIARPTRSVVLYTQMVGRVLRPWKGKTDALVLDVTGASSRHKLASIVDLTDYEVTQPEDDETLVDAARRSNVGLSLPLSTIAWEDVDLFHSSGAAWLMTRGGAWFISVPDAHYFLVAGSSPEAYRIRRWMRGAGVQTPDLDTDYPLEYAMRWAEMYAARHGGSIARRDASWRARPATVKQIAACRRNNIPLRPDATQGLASDAMAIYFASRTIDRYTSTLGGMAA
ncbi:DEAD/DEAH box helicase [Streptomyces sp. HUAS ZL42]|uniref:DEAD/DEAH box helicase n=1 Tax=Streptomyces sp. HUAS ZL42 TaxID=3231715 RepID=UPI00345E16CB